MRDPSLDVQTLHQLARKAREGMTAAEIAHAARIARANMRLTAKLKDAWRRQCRDEGADDVIHCCAGIGYANSPSLKALPRGGR